MYFLLCDRVHTPLSPGILSRIRPIVLAKEIISVCDVSRVDC